MQVVKASVAVRSNAWNNDVMCCCQHLEWVSSGKEILLEEECSVVVPGAWFTSRGHEIAKLPVKAQKPL
eukprot:6480113-Amphidinium_carterae.2